MYDIYAKRIGKINDKPIKTKIGVLNLIKRAFKGNNMPSLEIRKR